MLKYLANGCIKLDPMYYLPVIALLLGLAVPVLGQEPVAQEKDALWPEREMLEHFLRKAKVTERKCIPEAITPAVLIKSRQRGSVLGEDLAKAVAPDELRVSHVLKHRRDGPLAGPLRRGQCGTR